MSEKFAVGIDGSEAAKRALDFAVAHAKAHGEQLYSFTSLNGRLTLS